MPFTKGGPADTLFSGPDERLQNKLQALNNMKLNSIQLPMNGKVQQMQNFKEKFKNISFDRPLFAPKVRTSMEKGGAIHDTRFRGTHEKKNFVPTDYEPH